MTLRRRFSRQALCRGAVGAAVAALLALAATPPAFAGRMLVTGHDADAHCANADPPQGQCHFVGATINYVRATAPNPARPLLLLDCTSTRELQDAVNLALGPQSGTTMCPAKTAAFKSEPLTADRYSAIVLGSSGDLMNINALSTTPDSIAVNARAADIGTFFNEGGGVLAFSGGVNADGVDAPEPDTYYRFMPIPLGGVRANPPFTLTPAGIALGLSDDVNCCPTHNSFQEPPPGSALQVAERDRLGAPETLFAEGTIGAKTIVVGPSTGEVIDAPSAKKCVKRRRIRIGIRQPAGKHVQRVKVYVNGRLVRTLKSKSFARKNRVTVTLKRLRGTSVRVRIVVRTTEGVVYERARKYSTCAKKTRKKSSRRKRFTR